MRELGVPGGVTPGTGLRQGILAFGTSKNESQTKEKSE
jgi:hypothetical protein